jgi:hypothetical protein
LLQHGHTILRLVLKEPTRSNRVCLPASSQSLQFPSAKVIKRILSSPQLPRSVRQKIEQYVEEKVSGLYGHSETATRSYRNQFQRRGS